MKNNNGARCPGCGKHCPMDNVRCKYGMKYFASQTAAAENETKHKWEKFVEKGGLIWRLMMLGRGTKKALKKKKHTEAQLMDRLTADDKEQLAGILDKLEGGSAAI